MWALQSRFRKVEIAKWQCVKIALRRAYTKAFAPVERWRSKVAYRMLFEREYPFIEPGELPPGLWIADAAAPSGKRWDGQRTWRTRIGLSTICWQHGSPYHRAFNIRMPDGSRADLHQSMTGWRRKVKNSKRWIYGTLDFGDTDVAFLDIAQQPTYPPPPLSDTPNLEAELARSTDFIAALQDDRFVLAAYNRLAFGEWMKVGHREFETFASNGSIAHMIAGLRNLGEEYLDIKIAANEGGLSSPRHVQQLHDLLSVIGWRTHTADEMKAIFRADFQGRLRDRVDLLHQIKILESRPHGHCDPWLAKAPFGALEMPIYDEDDPVWLEGLTPQQEAARSREISARLFSLATNAQIERQEYNELAQKLGWKLPGLYK